MSRRVAAFLDDGEYVDNESKKAKLDDYETLRALVKKSDVEKIDQLIARLISKKLLLRRGDNVVKTPMYLALEYGDNATIDALCRSPHRARLQECFFLNNAARDCVDIYDRNKDSIGKIAHFIVEHRKIALPMIERCRSIYITRLLILTTRTKQSHALRVLLSSPRIRSLIDKRHTMEEGSWTPLFAASYNFHFTLSVECAMILLEHGANPTVINCVGNTPLYALISESRQLSTMRTAKEAKEHEDAEIAAIPFVKKLLESGADPKKRFQNKESAMEAAAHHGLWKIVRLFFEHGVTGNFVIDDDGTTLLMLAASRGDLQFVEMCLEFGGDPLLCKKRIVNAIFVAFASRRFKVLRLLAAHVNNAALFTQNALTFMFNAVFYNWYGVSASVGEKNRFRQPCLEFVSEEQFDTIRPLDRAHGFVGLEYSFSYETSSRRVLRRNAEEETGHNYHYASEPFFIALAEREAVARAAVLAQDRAFADRVKRTFGPELTTEHVEEEEEKGEEGEIKDQVEED